VKPDRQRNGVFRLGLTGGIGSGKSTVAAMLVDRGAVLIDADALSRASTAAGGSAMHEIRATFGDNFVNADGALNRERMREHVFADPSAKARLESIVHPLVRAEIDRQCASLARGVALLDLPLLVESRAWRERVDAVWVVDCEPETQIQRVMNRNGWTREQVHAVLASQSSRETRLAAADAVIANGADTTLDVLQLQVANLWEQNRQQFGL
jgi:dephospho-CoA kinase